MWPRHKVRLAAPLDAQGLKGMECLLTLMGIQSETVIPEQADRVQSSVWEFGDTPPTEVIFWPGTYRDEQIAALKSRGIEVHDLSVFFKSLWQSEHIIALSFQTPMRNGKPLAFELLCQAEFSPSLVWPDDHGEWQGVRGEGLAWVVPAEWLNELGVPELGRPRGGESVHWVVRETQIDFYLRPDGFDYLGSIPRLEDAQQEEAVCFALARVLAEGVTWNDIEKNMSDLLQSQKYHGIRWNRNESGDAAGESRQELSPGQSQYLENRRAS